MSTKIYQGGSNYGGDPRQAQRPKEERKTNLLNAAQSTLGSGNYNPYNDYGMTNTYGKPQAPASYQNNYNQNNAYGSKFGANKPPTNEEIVQAQSSLKLIKAKMRTTEINGGLAAPQINKNNRTVDTFSRLDGYQPKDNDSNPYAKNQYNQLNGNYGQKFKPNINEDVVDQNTNALEKELLSLNQNMSSKQQRLGNMNRRFEDEKIVKPADAYPNNQSNKPPLFSNKGTLDSMPAQQLNHNNSRRMQNNPPVSTKNNSEGWNNPQVQAKPPIATKTNQQNTKLFGEENQRQKKEEPLVMPSRNANQESSLKGGKDMKSVKSNPQPPPKYQKPESEEEPEDDEEDEDENDQNDPNGDPGELIDCPEGCGRKFNQKALKKHKKVCKKVFQSKRKKFDSKMHRVEDEEQLALEKQNKRIQQTIDKKKAVAKEKWKAESEAFRANIKAARGENLSVEEKKAIQQVQDDTTIKCDHCGRKFNEQAAKKHIPFCANKAKLDNLKKGGKKTGK